MKRTLALLTGAAIAIARFATVSDANAQGRPGVASVAGGVSGARRLMATQTRAMEEIRGNCTHLDAAFAARLSDIAELGRLPSIMDSARRATAKAATQDIPLIFLMGIDPVELGLVASLNRPGGNLTGVALPIAVIAEKRLDLLHQAVPTADTIALLRGAADVPYKVTPYDRAEARHVQSAARILGLRLLVFNVTTDTEITEAFAMVVEHQAGAILVGGPALVNAMRDQILSHAARFALPTMFFNSIDAREGGLLSYGLDINETFRQMGAYTGRILKGEKPADLPVVQPTKFKFVINLKTAKALGLTIPPNLLAIADEVIDE